MHRLVLALALGAVVAPRVARAEPPDAVALLPLDAEQRLEIYGQPIASALASALGAAGLEVVVVGPKMAVPERARLVIDGTIKAGKGNAVALAVRVREKANGTVLDTLSVTAPELTAIEHAAEEMSALVLPSVKKHLAALHDTRKIETPKTDTAAPPAPATPRTVILASSGVPALRDAIASAVTAWTARHHAVARAIDGKRLAGRVAAQTVASENAELAVAFEVLDYAFEAGSPPMARARVRVRVADRGHVAFDRVVVTDTVVGDRAMAPDALAARVAASVLAIIEPHVKRAYATW